MALVPASVQKEGGHQAGPAPSLCPPPTPPPLHPCHAWNPPSSVESWNFFLLGVLVNTGRPAGRTFQRKDGGGRSSIHSSETKWSLPASPDSPASALDPSTRLRTLGPFSCRLLPQPHQRARRGRLAALPVGGALMFAPGGGPPLARVFPCILPVIQLPPTASKATERGRSPLLFPGISLATGLASQHDFVSLVFFFPPVLSSG